MYCRACVIMCALLCVCVCCGVLIFVYVLLHKAGKAKRQAGMSATCWGTVIHLVPHTPLPSMLYVHRRQSGVERSDET